MGLFFLPGKPLQPDGAAAWAIAFAQVHRLPGAEAQLAVFHKECQGRPVQGGLYVGVAVAFGVVVIAVARHKVAEKGQHVAPHVGICPFVDCQAAGGVRAEKGQHAVAPALFNGIAPHQAA